MHTASHMVIGNAIYSEIVSKFGIKLPYASFVYGNISPDFSLSFFIKAHTVEEAYDYISSLTKSLERIDVTTRFGRTVFAHRLGVISHYLCDFFCYAHSPNFNDKVSVHFQYEKELHEFLYERRHSLLDCNEYKVSGSIPLALKRLDKAQEAYLSSPMSMELDIREAVAACRSLCSSAVAAAIQTECRFKLVTT